MAVVKPFDEKQWKQIKEMIRVGPTDESISIVKNALKRANKIKRTY